MWFDAYDGVGEWLGEFKGLGVADVEVGEGEPEMAEGVEVEEECGGEDGCGEEEGGEGEEGVGFVDGEGVGFDGVGVVVLQCHFL